MTINVPAWYYAHHGADYSLEHPGQGFGGWTKTEIPIDPEHTAILVMHAWYQAPYELVPSIWKRVEYIPRAQKIMAEAFPGFLEKVRASGVRLIHIGSRSEKSLESLPGYQRVKAAFPPEAPFERIEQDETAKALQEFRRIHVHGDNNPEESRINYSTRDFAIRPLDDEDVACTTGQLFYLCKKYQITHLIYTGFAVNACLTMSPCGFFDMTRHGLICSIVEDLTTGVENRESCAAEANKAYGLWSFGLWGGFKFEKADIENTLLKG